MYSHIRDHEIKLNWPCVWGRARKFSNGTVSTCEEVFLVPLFSQPHNYLKFTKVSFSQLAESAYCIEVIERAYAVSRQLTQNFDECTTTSALWGVVTCLFRVVDQICSVRVGSEKNCYKSDNDRSSTRETDLKYKLCRLDNMI